MTSIDIIASTAQDRVRAALLAPTDIDETLLARLLQRMTQGRADSADIFLERGTSEVWRMDSGRVSGGSYDMIGGAGLRAIEGDRAGFAYTASLAAGALAGAAEAASALSRDTGRAPVEIAPPVPWRQSAPALYGAGDPTASDHAIKTALLLRIDAAARARDPRIVNVTASCRAEQRIVMVMREDGRMAADVRPLIHFQLEAVAESGGRREIGNAGGGGRYLFEDLPDPLIDDAVARAVDMALINLDSRPAPSGPMTVVLGPGFPGVLLHEAVGHGLEGDYNRRGSSAFSGRIGERIAAPGVTVIDDGTIAHARGSLSIDDEGEPTGRTTLIEDGYLVGYLQDALNARLMNMRPTGNGRRQSYADLPMPRMTNTYLRNGDVDPADIVKSVKSGIFAKAFGGGNVDIVSGQFNFSTTEAYLIENGQITAPVRGATLIGSGPTSLKDMVMIGSDLALDTGVAVCGKAGQSLPVGVGQPTVRIDRMTVGGAG